MYKSPRCFLLSVKSIGLLEQNIYFQDGSHGGHLGFLTGRILAIFDLQLTLMLSIKFQVILAFRFRRRSENRFSRWLPWWPSWISDRKILVIFYLQVTAMLPIKFQVNWPFGSGEEGKNRF